MKMKTEEHENQGTFIAVYGWMTSLGRRFSLTPAQLLVFAAIHGFTRSCGCYSGSREYLASVAYCTRRWVVSAVRRLSELGLISVSGGGRRLASLVGINGEEPGESPREEGVNEVRKGVNGVHETVNGVPENVNGVHPIIQKQNNNKTDNTLSPRGGERQAGTGSGGESDRSCVHKRGSEKASFRAEFAELWERYPRREGRAAAERCYLAARAKGVPRESIEKALLAYAERVRRQGLEPRYIKQGGNWFRERCWEDGESVFSEPQPGCAPPKPAQPRAAPVDRALNYRQRRYTREMLLALGVDLGESIYEEETEP